MVSTICRVAAISAGPRSASPRGRRALSFCGFFALSGIFRCVARCVELPLRSSGFRLCHYRANGSMFGLRWRAPSCFETRRFAALLSMRLPMNIAVTVPNDLDPFWMPFTANRAFKKRPRLISGAKDMHYITPEGRKLLDGSAGLWCTNAGHNRDPIVAAIQRQAAELDYAPAFQFGHPQAFELANRISALAPGDLDHVFFCNSGSEAVDTALKIALAWQAVRGEGMRTRLIGRERGYHGVGFGGISVGGIVNNRKMFGTLLAGVDHLPSTYNREHQAFTKGEPEYGIHFADELERLVNLHGASTMAAVIVEPMAGSTGVLPAPKGYLKRLRELTQKHGILLIFDEVITGYGRLGFAFAAERYGVVPDMLPFAKGITNGA